MKSFSMHPALTADTTVAINLDFGRPFEAQIKSFLESLPDLRGMMSVVLPGQAVAASLVLPALEMAVGLPMITLYGFGKEVKSLGELSLNEYRHNQVRPRRTDLPRGGAFDGFTVFDGGGRGLTPVQMTELAAALGCPEDAIRVLDVNMGQVDFTCPQQGMIEKVLATGVTFDDLTSGRVLHLPAGSGLIGALMATTIYGLAEGWPRCIRLAQGEDKQFHLAEIVDCQGMRRFGVELGAKWRDAQPALTLSGQIPEEFRAALVALAAEHGVEIRG